MTLIKILELNAFVYICFLTCTIRLYKLKASDDKENQPPSTSTIQTRSAASRSRNPLGNVNVNIPQQAAAPPPPPPPRVQSNRQEQQRQTAQPKQQPPPQQKQQQHQQHLLLQNLSFANIQFEHQYRISNRSILKMVNILFGHKYDSKLFTTQVLTNVVLLVSDEKFTQYMIKVVERKLKTMLASTTNKIYDPYSSTSYGTFAMLSNLWMYAFIYTFYFVHVIFGNMKKNSIVVLGVLVSESMAPTVRKVHLSPK